jgi:hypothetical protein
MTIDTKREISPQQALEALARHISSNPFATDRRTTMVGAIGRKLQTELGRVQALIAAAAAAEESLGALVAEAVAVLNGTAPGLTAGTKGAK